MKTKTYVHNLIILDQSGSMQSIFTQALGGVNETFQTIQAAHAKFPDQIQKITLMNFCSLERNRFDYIIINEEADRVRQLTENDYHPDGCTPLYDAIGIGIKKLAPYVHEGDKVLVTIITDGMENSSVDYDHHRLGKLISRYKEKGWVFTYIGANQDSHGVAKSINIENAMNFNANEESADLMFRKMNACRMRCYEDAQIFGNMCSDDFFRNSEQLERISDIGTGKKKDNEIEVSGSDDIEGLVDNIYYIRTDSPDNVVKTVDELVQYADLHPEKVFCVWPIPAGKAGLSERDFAKIFSKCMGMRNIKLPLAYWAIINSI